MMRFSLPRCPSFLKPLAFSLFLSFFLSFPAGAALEEGKYSDTEKVGFAFSKLGNTRPGFESWIEHSPAYLAAKPVEKMTLMKEGTARLQEGFYSYNPAEDFIHVEADILIQRPADRPGKRDAPAPASPDDAEKKVIRISFGKGDSYFPFQVGKLWIAVIPKDIEAFESIALTPDEYQIFAQGMGTTVRRHSEMTGIIDILLRPVSADAKSPVVVGKEPYWPMLAEIVNVTIWNNSKDRIAWSYDANGYVSQGKKDLMNLYDDK
jgi:hypothetical protein